MKMLLNQVKRKVNGFILTLIIAGIVLLILGAFIILNDFILRLTIGIIIILLAYIFFYSAHKIWTLKREIEKYFKLK